jgi:hypothetical protein
LKLLSRYKSYANWTCDFKRTVKEKLMGYWKVSYKNIADQNYRQLIELKNIDGCMIMDNLNNFPIFKPIVEMVNDEVPGFFHKCPYDKVSKDLSFKENV